MYRFHSKTNSLIAGLLAVLIIFVLPAQSVLSSSLPSTTLGEIPSVSISDSNSSSSPMDSISIHRTSIEESLENTTLENTILNSDIALNVETAINNSLLYSYFEENKGQFDSEVAFAADILDGNAFISNNGSINYNFPTDEGIRSITETLLNATQTEITANEEIDGTFNYLHESLDNPVTNVQRFKELFYGEVYNGIQLKLFAKDTNVEKVFYVQPEVGNPSDIALGFDSIESLEISDSGELLVNSEYGSVIFSEPIAFQYDDANNKVDVDVEYLLHSDSSYGFLLGNYDQSRELVIDPFVRSSYLGGSNNDIILDVTTDASGNIYVTGYTSSVNFPNTSGLTPCLDYEDLNFTCNSPVGTDAFIAKFSSDLKSLSTATFIGGTGIDNSFAIKIDETQGDVFIAGATLSPGFLPNLVSGSNIGYGSNNGGVDAFILKVDSDLDTFLGYVMAGGTGTDIFYDIDVVGNKVHAVGTSSGVAVQATYEKDANLSWPANYELQEDMFYFVATGVLYGIDGGYTVGSLSGNLSAVVRLTNEFEIFLGTTPSPTYIDTDANLTDVVYNTVTNTYWAVGNGILSAGGNNTELQLVEFNSNLSNISGVNIDMSGGTLVDSLTFDPTSGDVMAVVSTVSPNLIQTSTNALTSRAYNGGTDAYVMQFSEGTFDDNSFNASTDVTFSSYYGTAGTDNGYAIGFDSVTGNYILAGTTNSGALTDTQDAYDTTYNGGTADGFVNIFNIDQVVEKPQVFNDYLFPGYESTDPDVDFSYSGNFTTLVGESYLQIDPSKSYRLEGEFRSTGTVDSNLYFGLAEADTKRYEIIPEYVNRVSPSTDSVSFNSINTARTEITVDQAIPASWCEDNTDTTPNNLPCSNVKARTLAVYLDGDTTKLPNFITRYSTINGNKITLSNPLVEMATGLFTQNTVFLNHQSGNTYNFAGANNVVVPNTWTTYESSIITGESFDDLSDTFRVGTEFARVALFANFGQSGLDTTLEMRNINLYEVQPDGSELSVAINTLNNADVTPRFECQPGESVVMVTGNNSTLFSTEGIHTVEAVCEDNSTGTQSDVKTVTFEIDKTAPSAPTWDSLPSGTYSSGQTIEVTPDINNEILIYGSAGGQNLGLYTLIDSVYLQSNGTNDRDYAIRVKQIDQAGNVSSAGNVYYYTITAPSYSWLSTEATSTEEFANGVITDDLGNSYVMGLFSGTLTIGSQSVTSNGNFDHYIAKYNDQGQIQWIKNIGGTGSDSGKAGLTFDSTGNLVFTGRYFNSITFASTTHNLSTGFDSFVGALDTNGNELWGFAFGGTGLETPQNIAVDASDNVYITGIFDTDITVGATTVTSTGNYDIFVLKLNSSQVPQWIVSGGGSGFDNVSDITTDGTSAYLTGYYSGTATYGTHSITSAGGNDGFLLEVDSSGVFQSAESYGGTGNDATWGVELDSNGDRIIAGYYTTSATFGTTTINGGASPNGFIMKHNGTIDWVESLLTGSRVAPGAIALGSDDSIYLTGYYSNTVSFGNYNETAVGGNDMFVMGLDSTANPEWMLSGGGTNGVEQGMSLGVDANNNVYVYGFSEGDVDFGGLNATNVGAKDNFLVKVPN